MPIWGLCAWYALSHDGTTKAWEVGVAIAAVVFSTYMMAEINNRNALIRIYSRMVSCCFLILTTMLTFLYWDMGRTVIMITSTLFLLWLLHTYQDRRSSGWVFYTFCCVSVASIYFVQVLYLVPILWLMMTTKLISMSWRTFFASILGLLAPYWILAAFLAWQGCLGLLPLHFAMLADFSQICDFSMLSIREIVTGAYILICALIGTIHFLHTKQLDRIKIQVIYEMIIIINMVCIVFLILQPVHFRNLIGIIIVCTSILIAHFIALTSTRWTNLLTKVLMLLAVAITIFNIWNPSLNF